MKIGVSSYSFSGVMRTGEYNQFTVIQKAKDMGFDAIEFEDMEYPIKALEIGLANLRRYVENAGL